MIFLANFLFVVAITTPTVHLNVDSFSDYDFLQLVYNKIITSVKLKMQSWFYLYSCTCILFVGDLIVLIINKNRTEWIKNIRNKKQIKRKEDFLICVINLKPSESLFNNSYC